MAFYRKQKRIDELQSLLAETQARLAAVEARLAFLGPECERLRAEHAQVLDRLLMISGVPPLHAPLSTAPRPEDMQPVHPRNSIREFTRKMQQVEDQALADSRKEALQELVNDAPNSTQGATNASPN